MSVSGFSSSQRVCLLVQMMHAGYPGQYTDTRASVDCKYFLEGRCSLGDACPFRHRAVSNLIFCRLLIQHVSAPGTTCICPQTYQVQFLTCCFAGVIQHSSKGKSSSSSSLTANSVPLLPQWQMHKRSLMRLPACELP